MSARPGNDMDHMIRPTAMVLPTSALVPDRNLRLPAPTRFTHEVIADQPYYYRDPGPTDAPDGIFSAGTKVVLLSHEGGTLCQVVDGQGLYVTMAYVGLRPFL